jgi:hypothetical protein
MELARREDAASKIDTVSNLKPSASKRARKMRQATDRAAVEVEKTRRSDPTSVIERTIKALRQSSHWRAAAPQIIAFLRRLCRKYGVAITTKTNEGSIAA